jgi:hypothetical protein
VTKPILKTSIAKFWKIFSVQPTRPAGQAPRVGTQESPRSWVSDTADCPITSFAKASGPFAALSRLLLAHSFRFQHNPNRLSAMWAAVLGLPFEGFPFQPPDKFAHARRMHPNLMISLQLVGDLLVALAFLVESLDL